VTDLEYRSLPGNFRNESLRRDSRDPKRERDGVRGWRNDSWKIATRNTRADIFSDLLTVTRM